MGQEGKKYLLLIGIDEYQHLGTFTSPVRDVVETGDLLQSLYGFTERRQLLNRNADKDAILAGLASLRYTNPEDMVVIYYTGHGHTDEFYRMNYWLPYDAEDVKTGRTDRWLPSSMVTGAMLNIPARHILLINDSCFSGDLLESHKDVQERKAGYEQTAMLYRAREVLTSGMGEPVVDAGLGGHSAFAFHLMDALAHASRPWIDALDMFQCIKRGVQGQTPLHGSLRNSGHQEGGACILRRSDADCGSTSEGDGWKTWL